MARLKGITQFYPPLTRLSTNKMSHTAFNSQPQSISALWPVLISRPTEGRRLSWPGWLVERQNNSPTAVTLRLMLQAVCVVCVCVCVCVFANEY